MYYTGHYWQKICSIQVLKAKFVSFFIQFRKYFSANHIQTSNDVTETWKAAWGVHRIRFTVCQNEVKKYHCSGLFNGRLQDQVETETYEIHSRKIHYLQCLSLIFQNKIVLSWRPRRPGGSTSNWQNYSTRANNPKKKRIQLINKYKETI